MREPFTTAVDVVCHLDGRVRVVFGIRGNHRLVEDDCGEFDSKTKGNWIFVNKKKIKG